jgi:hypothetical protein
MYRKELGDVYVYMKRVKIWSQEDWGPTLGGKEG